MRKNRMKKWIGILLAMCLVVGLLPGTAMAAELPDNPAGITLDVLAKGDIMSKNEGTVTVNNGDIHLNYGTITENNGTVLENKEGATLNNNTSEGYIAENYSDIPINNGWVDINFGIMDKNEGMVNVNDGEINHNRGTVTMHNGMMSFNYGTITENNGTVLENKAGGVIADNEGDGFVTDNYGDITENNGEVSTNHGTITENNGEVSINHGTIAENKGTVEMNFGTVTSNDGTVKYNCGGTVNGGTVEYDYIYTIDISGIADNDKFLVYGDNEAAYQLYDKVYIKENAVITIQAYNGYKFTDDGIPKITAGSGTITDNGDGTYTLTGVTGNISLFAAFAHVPVTDITGVPSTVYAGIITDLYNNVAVKPEGASMEICWEIVDSGTTGATIDDPYSGILSVTAEGVVKIKATIRNGKSETEDFVKEFTITVKDAVESVYTAYTALKTALTGDDLDALNTAAEGFASLMQVYNAFGDAKKSELAERLGMESGEEAFDAFLTDWINTNVILQVAELYRAYLDDPNQETKSAFVANYDSIFKDPNYEDEALMALVRKFIPDIDDVYAEIAGENIDSTSAEYVFTEGANQTWSGKGELSFTIDNKGALMIEVAVGEKNGDTVEILIEGLSDDYGSPVINDGKDHIVLFEKYLKTLAPGDYVLMIKYEDGFASTYFTVSGVPKTGDNSYIGLWIGFMMIAFAGLAACAVLWRKKRTN